MKPYKPSNAPEALYPTANQARSNTFTRAGAILLAAAASAAVLSGCGGEEPVTLDGDIAVPTVTTTAEGQPMTPGESFVDVGGEPTVSVDGDVATTFKPTYTVTVTHSEETRTEYPPTYQGTIVVTTTETTEEPELLPTGSVCADNATATSERPVTAVGTMYIPDEDETTAAETHASTAGVIPVENE